MAQEMGIPPEQAIGHLRRVRSEEARYRAAWGTRRVAEGLRATVDVGRQFLGVLYGGAGAAAGAAGHAGHLALEGGRRGAVAIADAGVAAGTVVAPATAGLMRAAQRQAYSLPRQLGYIAGGLADVLGSIGGPHVDADMRAAFQRAITAVDPRDERQLWRRQHPNPATLPFAVQDEEGGVFGRGSPFVPIDTSGGTIQTLRRPGRSGGRIAIT
jgi:hypothetical protein